MSNFIRYFFLLIVSVLQFGTVLCEALHIQAEDAQVLEDFISVMCWESEGGYVLYGKKPVCIHGFYVSDNFGGPSEAHRNSVYIKEGASAWNRIFQREDSSLIVHSYDQPDSAVKEYIHVLFIHKDLFYKTVQENLTLFQYVLGPNLTPESLLRELINPKQTFHNVLKEDKVLIGILLGFGAQNALLGSRLENLQDAYANYGENVPLKNKLLAVDSILGCYKDIFLMRANTDAKESILQPSFSYKTFEDEVANSLDLLEISSPKLSEKQPRFIFGRLKTQENDQLVKELEETQEDIIELLSSSDYFKKILKMIYPHKEIIIEEKRASTLKIEDSSRLLGVVSESIKDWLSEENESYFKGYIKGLEDAEKKVKNLEITNFPFYEKSKALKIAKENITEADYLFSELESKGFVPLSRGKVIFKTLKEGTGTTLNDQAVVFINFKIKTPKDEVLRDTWAEKQPTKLDLKETISGFSLGLKGMREGELREIFIHPSVAYGLYTNLDKGIYLSAEVELLSIEDFKTAIPFNEVEQFDFAQAFNYLSEISFDEISKNEGYLRGYAVGSHYKNQAFFSLSQLIEAIKKDTQNHVVSDADDCLINKLHWNIYHDSNVL